MGNCLLSKLCVGGQFFHSENNHDKFSALIKAHPGHTSEGIMAFKTIKPVGRGWTDMSSVCMLPEGGLATPHELIPQSVYFT